MRCLTSSLSPTLLLCGLTIFLSCVNADPPRPLPPLTQDAFQMTPGVPPINANSKSWISRIRDSLIQTIWHVPANRTTHCSKSSSRPNPPLTVLARYGGDLVLRFKVSSFEQAEALAEAVHVLFLDVWESTPNWVDIRLSKDVVSLVALGDSGLH